MVDSVTNVVRLSIHINNALNRNINSHYAFIVLRRVISLESALRTRKDCIEREVHASGAGQCDTH